MSNHQSFIPWAEQRLPMQMLAGAKSPAANVQHAAIRALWERQKWLMRWQMKLIARLGSSSDKEAAA